MRGWVTGRPFLHSGLGNEHESVQVDLSHDPSTKILQDHASASAAYSVYEERDMRQINQHSRVRTPSDENISTGASYNEAPRLEAGRKPGGCGHDDEVDSVTSQSHPERVSAGHSEFSKSAQDVQGNEGAGATSDPPADACKSYSTNDFATRDASSPTANNPLETEDSVTRNPGRTSTLR